MQLLLSPTSPYARAVRIALMLKGLDDECTVGWVDPASDTPELVQANPMSRVPTLLLDDGTALTETALILQYLDRRVPHPPLIPSASANSELALAGRALAMMDAALWIMNNCKYLGADANDNALGERRLGTLRRSLEDFKTNPPRPVGQVVGMGQILLQVAIEYLEFRFPELEATETSGLADWGKPLRKLEPFHLTEPH